MLGLNITKIPTQQLRATTSMLGLRSKINTSTSGTITGTNFDNMTGCTAVLFCENIGRMSLSTCLYDFIKMFKNVSGDFTGFGLNTSGSFRWDSFAQVLKGLYYDGATQHGGFTQNIEYDSFGTTDTTKDGALKYCIFFRFNASLSEDEVTIGHISPKEISVGKSDNSPANLGVLENGDIVLSRDEFGGFGTSICKILKASIWNESLTDAQILKLVGLENTGLSLTTTTKETMRNFHMKSRFTSYSDMSINNPILEYDFTKSNNWDDSALNVPGSQSGRDLKASIGSIELDVTGAPNICNSSET